MIKAVFVDVDNTLLDFDKCAEYAARNAFSDFGLPFGPEVTERFHEINEGLWREVEKGTISRDALFDVRWARILSALGIEFDGHVLEKRFFSYITEAAEPVDGANELLEYLANKYTVCITSNAGFAQQKKRLARAEMLKYVDKLFISEKIGFAKPERGFFDGCFAELSDVLPCETVIIGDSPTADIKGGSSYGIKTIWYNHGKMAETGGIHADFTVDSLDKIKDII